MSVGDQQIEGLVDDLSARELDALEITCDCADDSVWGAHDFEAMTRWPGEMFEMPEADRLLAMCPECAHIRNVGIRPYNVTDEEYSLRFELGEIILSAEDASTGRMRQFNDKLDRAVGLDPDRLWSCEECGTPLFSSDLTCGPEAPEIGWEYYECSGCSEYYTPATVEGSR